MEGLRKPITIDNDPQIQGSSTDPFTRINKFKNAGIKGSTSSKIYHKSQGLKKPRYSLQENKDFSALSK
jgi:hypothetical protein